MEVQHVGGDGWRPVLHCSAGVLHICRRCGREGRRAQGEGVESAPACWLRTVQLAQANRVGRACVDPRPANHPLLTSGAVHNRRSTAHT